MPIAPVFSHCQVTLVSLNRPSGWEVSDWLLDESGFPWEILTINQGSMILKPMLDHPGLKHSIGTLAPIRERTASAYLNRVLEYMSRIEALDLTLKRISCGDWYDSWSENKWVMDLKNNFEPNSTAAPKGTVLITDCNGIEWGPLPCDPLVAPDTWPFKGGIKSCNLTFTPTSCNSCWTIRMPPFRIDVLEFHQLCKVALELRDVGWLEMVQRNYPSGLNLSIEQDTQPSAPH